MKLLLENWREYLKEEQDYLYHGTQKRHLPDILKKGLSPFFSQSSMDAIFLGGMSTAQNYTLMHSDDGEEAAILKIDLSKLDKNKLMPDNVELQEFLNGEWGEVPEELEGLRWNELSWQDSLKYVDQVSYHGDIPPEAIEIV
jgi:hypothetical protein